jgi:hypothetical protein
VVPGIIASGTTPRLPSSCRAIDCVFYPSSPAPATSPVASTEGSLARNLNKLGCGCGPIALLAQVDIRYKKRSLEPARPRERLVTADAKCYFIRSKTNSVVRITPFRGCAGTL